LDLKQSFEQRLKRQGIEPDSALKTREEEYFKGFRNCKFWVKDKQQHRKAYHETGGRCCFWHILGLPQKNGTPMPMFDYEWEIYNTLEKQERGSIKDKHLWIKKATGLGITTFMLYFIAYKCLVNDDWKGKQVCIVTGPNIDLAITLMDRLKRLFPDVVFDSKETVCELGECHIQAYPSNHLDAMRSLVDVVLIYQDEADFFPVGQQKDARDVSERYIAKSNSYLVMTSTPNAPEGLFEQIEREPEDLCLYHRIQLPYTVGLNKIYTPEEILEQRSSPGFEREYNLKYIGLQGNVFSPQSIETATEIGAKLYADRKSGIPWSTRKSMGIDAGFGSSKFAIVVTHINEAEGVVEVLYANEFERPDFNAMISEILSIKRNYHVDKMYVDNANPEIVSSLKRALNEPLDYHQELARIKAKKLGHPSLWMDVLPVSFAAEHKEMLGHTKLLLDRGSLAVASIFDKLLISLRTAHATEGDLSKDKTSHDDLLDALRLSLKRYTIPSPTNTVSSAALPMQNQQHHQYREEALAR
jgi:hypothetical protein